MSLSGTSGAVHKMANKYPDINLRVKNFEDFTFASEKELHSRGLISRVGHFQIFFFAEI